VLDALRRKYVWVNGIEGWTVAVMRRRPVDEVVRIYGGADSELMGELAFIDVDRYRDPDISHVEFFVQILECAGHTVTLEHNGFSGAFPEIARRCSAAAGWFFSVYWNIHAAGVVTQAIDGVVTAYFDSLYPLHPKVEEWERRPRWAIGPEVDVNVARPVCMAELELQTGVAVEQRWLAEAHPTYRIPMPYGLYQDVPGADRI
jgi:hypothetical protein